GNTGSGVVVKSGPTVIVGNKIGTDLAGAAALANTENGVSILSDQVTVGGTTAAVRNLISGNTQNGILVQNFTATAILIQGNYIGTDLGGASSIASQQTGVAVSNTAGLVVGGTVAGAGNVISGNTVNGISTSGGSKITVAGNRIGTNA